MRLIVLLVLVLVELNAPLAEFVYLEALVVVGVLECLLSPLPFLLILLEHLLLQSINIAHDVPNLSSHIEALNEVIRG